MFTTYCPNHRFFNKKKFLIEEDLYIYINNLSCFKRSKTLTAKKILPTDIKVSDLQENQLDLNWIHQISFFSSWNGIIFSVSREFDFFLVQLVSKIQLVSVSIDFVPFSKNCRFPETHWGPSLAPYSSCVHLCGFWIEVHWDLPFWPMLFSLGASFSTLPQLTVEQKFKNFKQPEFFVY